MTELTNEEKLKLERLRERCIIIQGLLKRWHESAVEIVIALKEVDDEGDWKLSYPSFDNFLERNFPNSGFGLKRYQHTLLSIQEYGEELVRKIGPEAAHVMSHPRITEEPARKNEIISNVNNYMEANGNAPNADWVREQRKRIAPETNQPPRSTIAMSALGRTCKERDEWRRKFEELQVKYDSAVSEIEQLRKQLGKNASTSTSDMVS
jgi:hypothetical protein